MRSDEHARLVAAVCARYPKARTRGFHAFVNKVLAHQLGDDYRLKGHWYLVPDAWQVVRGRPHILEAIEVVVTCDITPAKFLSYAEYAWCLDGTNSFELQLRVVHRFGAEQTYSMHDLISFERSHQDNMRSLL